MSGLSVRNWTDLVTCFQAALNSLCWEPVSLHPIILTYYLCCVPSHSVIQFLAFPQTVVTRLLCLCYFSRQEYWSGLPCPPPRDLPNPGIEPRSPALQVDSLPSEPPEKPTLPIKLKKKKVSPFLILEMWTQKNSKRILCLKKLFWKKKISLHCEVIHLVKENICMCCA